MTGAMYAAVSGLKNHMNKLNVIGNNVANVNTFGYKAGRVTFTEALYTSVRSGSDGTGALGGTNPAQMGYGVQIGTIDLDMGTKNYVPTGGPLHCMINGDGFIMTGDKNGSVSSGAAVKDLNLSRLGDLGFDQDGYLVDGRGQVVYGFITAANAASGGGAADYANAQNAGQTTGVSTELTPIRLPMAAEAPKGTPGVGDPAYEGSAVYPSVDATTGKTTDAIKNVPANGAKRIQLESLSIDETGKITGINKATDEVVVVGYLAVASVDNPNGVTHTGGPYYRALGGAGDVVAASVGGVIKGYLGNKAVAGALPADMVTGTGKTKLVPNGLESSGTDIANEFSEMITTQRGYQANTRIITVTDSMLEELVNLKR